ncbi:MAG: TetR/AcrR family transcriptional regulator [Burkholderiales bacterium]|nr:TetR/AcrR family transcriptional regulator [Burkholderiales bacterium]
MPRDTVTDVKTRILEAALGLLAEHGVTELTQPKIAAAAGVRQSHLTYYFPTRMELLKAIAVHSLQSLMATLAANAPPGGFDLAAFARMAGEQVVDVRRTRVMLGLVVTADQDPDVRQFMRDFVATVRHHLGNLFRMLGKELDEDTIAAFHTLMVGVAILNVARNDARSRKESAALARIAVEKFLMEAPSVPAEKSPARRAAPKTGRGS